MGIDLRAASAEAQALYDLADRLTGLPVSHLCAEGPLDRLTETQIAQPAVVTTSLAALRVLREHVPDLQPRAVAGHSVGELSAYIAAGALEPEAGLSLVHARAQAMAGACAAVDGGMSAVLGLDEEPLRQACEAASQDGSSVEIANLNAPGQLVVAGERTALERLAELARTAGARRVLPLNVGGPFHSVYMRPAAESLQQALERTTFHPAQTDIVVNATATVAREPAMLRDELAVQVYSTVRWTDTVQRLSEMGCDRFLEVGPGAVLSGMLRRTAPSARVASFGSLADLTAVKSLLED